MLPGVGLRLLLENGQRGLQQLRGFLARVGDKAQPGSAPGMCWPGCCGVRSA